MYSYVVLPKSRLIKVRSEGISSGNALRKSLYGTLQAAQKARGSGDAILVASLQGNEVLNRKRLKSKDFLNLDPYEPPRYVPAAGGYLTRKRKGVTQLLLIFRRGNWELPKGKVDPGESISEAALREVREEIGIKSVKIRRDLGPTWHTYHQSRHLKIKPTYWYLMSTSETKFVPQKSENITAVKWWPWYEARAVLGHENMRMHAQRVEQFGLVKP